jgi:alkylation response protein AidB-like acyl-CoA dehydrogenase
MDFELDEDVQLLCDNVREFCRQEVVPNAPGWDEDGAWPEGLHAKLGELGLFGLRLSEQHGGSELSMVATVAVLEELAAADASVATVVAVHNVLGLPALALGDSTDAAELDRLAQGSAFVGWAGLDATGRSGFALGSPGSPMVASASGDAAGVFRLPDAAPRTPVDPLGLRAAPIVEVEVDPATLPATARLGDAAAASALVDMGRIALAAVLVGQGGAALRAGRDYALERQQFGKPIAKFQAIQWKVADSAVQLDAARLLTLRAAAMLDAGQDVRAAAAQAKLRAGAAGVAAGSHALQIHGGYGYTREFPVERALRNARVLDALLGGSRAHRAAVAQSIVTRYAG